MIAGNGPGMRLIQKNPGKSGVRSRYPTAVDRGVGMHESHSDLISAIVVAGVLHSVQWS